MSRPTPIRSFFILLLLGAILLTIALVVRSGMWEVRTNDEPINATMRAALARERPELTTDDSLLINRLYPTALVKKSGLRVVVRNPGHGPKPKRGDDVSIYYAGRLLDGTFFDSSYQSGVPFHFRVGTGAVIAAWDEAFLDMKRGEKRTLIVPYWLAFGVEGHPPSIPGKATLVFEVELIDFTTPPDSHSS